MKHSHETLPEHGYVLMDRLEHNELIPFVKQHLNKLSLVSVVFYGLNLLFLFLGALGIFKSIAQHEASIGDVLFHYFFGFTIVFLLIPIHEFIHVIAYRFLGARDTSLDYNLKKFYFMALANGFVTDKREFTIVALAPFVVITSLLLLLVFFTNHYWQLTIFSGLFLHTAMCSGDFGLLNYFHINKDKKLVTYDDVKNKVSYFYKAS